MLPADDPADLWVDEASGDGLRARSVRGAAITAIAQVARLILTLGSQIWLARLLAPVDFGLVAMTTPIIGFVAVIADLGITQALVSRPRLLRSEINAFFWLNIGITSGLALLAALSAPLIGWLYGESRVVPIALASAGMIAINGGALVQFALLTRAMRFGAVAGIEVASLMTSVIAGLASALCGAGYWSLVIAQAAASLILLVGAWLASSWRPSSPTLSAEARSMTAFGGQVTVSNLAGYLNATVDNVLIGAVRGPVELGLYDRAWRFGVQPLTMLMAPFSRVALPALSRVADQPDRYREAFDLMGQSMLIAVAPAMIVASIDSEAIVSTVLGVRWLAAAPIFAWLCVGAIISPVNNIIMWSFVTQGRVTEQMRVTIIAIGINLASYIIGVRFGVRQVAELSAISVYVLQTPILLRAIVRSGPINRSVLLRLLLPNLAASIVTIVISVLLQRHVAGIMGLASAGLASLASYLIVLQLIPTSRGVLRALVGSASHLLRHGQKPGHAGLPVQS